MNGSNHAGLEEVVTHAMRRVVALADWLRSGTGPHANVPGSGKGNWPLVPGAYVVGDPGGPVAICTLTNNELVKPLAGLPGVAIAGRVYSANLGIEKVIRNVTDNPSIRYLLVCGKESAYFQAGQALSALYAQGVTPEGRILGANGHLPELSHVDRNHIERFREQIELVDRMGESDFDRLAVPVRELVSRDPGPYQGVPLQGPASAPPGGDGNGFRPVRLGGHRESLAYDPMGFFVISLDRRARDILVHHYLPDNSPAHVVRGRNGEAILLALLREGLISQLSHAGYLGAELAKAETAIRLDLPYEQDWPLRMSEEPVRQE
jgi:tetrahydromethanopterin S-methyltransferase subunit A